MPCIELSLPKVSREMRAALAVELTQAFCDTTGHSAEIFGIRFFEYEDDMASNNGKLSAARLQCPISTWSFIAHAWRDLPSRKWEKPLPWLFRKL